MYVFKNPFTPSIAYSITKTAGGWVLDVNINGRIPASDRIKLIEWLQAYSLQVKSTVGNAATTLRVTPGGYALEVVVLTQQFFAAGRPAEQLDLSFAYA